MKRISINSLLGLAILVPVLIGAGAIANAGDDADGSGKKSNKKSKAVASMPLSPSGSWSLEKVLKMDRKQLFEKWTKLPPVPMNELNGHYMGLVPNAGHPDEQATTTDFMYNERSVRGYWLGKAFKAHSATKGEGYNRWRFPGGRVVRNLRFGTEMGVSLIDGRPAFLMLYGTYNEGNTLVDEIRKLDDYVYIGVGTRPTEDGGRTDPVGGVFILTGPTDEWVGVEED